MKFQLMHTCKQKTELSQLCGIQMVLITTKWDEHERKRDSRMVGMYGMGKLFWVILPVADYAFLFP